MQFKVFGQTYQCRFLDKVYDQNNLDIDFAIEYDSDTKTNTSRIHLWNLAKDTLDRLAEGLPIELRGGWEESNGPIFLGEITRFFTKKESRGQTRTTIYVGQDRDYWFNSTIANEWGAPIDVKDIVKDIINLTGFTLGYIDPKIVHSYKRPWGFSGKAKDALEELAEDCGADMYNMDGKIFFVRKGMSAIQKIVIESSHILESPQKAQEGLWKFRSILRHEARPGTLVDLRSVFKSGEFITTKVKHIKIDHKQFYTDWEVSTGEAKE